ncbi:MAG: hypothetical protein RR614_01565, partial [Eubacterium sp.]
LSLALLIYNEYMTATKVLTKHLLEQITSNDDLLFMTAVEIRILSRNTQTSPELARFLNELDNTHFYLKETSATFGFFENLNRRYHLGLDKNQVYAVAVTNYAMVTSLQAARRNGIIDCTNESILRTGFSYFAKALSFDSALIEKILDDSLSISEKMNISVGDNFQLRHR